MTASRLAWIRLFVTLAISILCLGLSGWLWRQDRTWPERAIYPLADPLANLNQLGVNADLAQYEPEELDRALSQVQAGGFHWIRQRFPWNAIQPQPDAFAWEPWDTIVAACASHDLRLIAVLDGSPSWARLDDSSEVLLAPPGEASDWGAFVSAFAGRYRDQIDVYQLWDEPNLAAHWGNRYVDPAAYTVLLREGAVRVRQADPGATILLAALAPTVERGPLNLNEVDFVKGILDAGGRPFFDVVALQPYGFGDPPGATAQPDRLNFRRAALVRRGMVHLGLEDCPVWATAWGWSTLPAEWKGQPSPWPSVPPAQQAGYTLEAIQLARQEWPWIGPLVLYTLQPDAPGDDPHWGFALLDPEGNPSALYGTLAEASRTAQPLHTGTYIPSPDNARYSGKWQFSEVGADPPHGADVAEQNASLAFDFQGTALDLTVRRGSFWGVLYVTIDGVSPADLPRDEQGRAYVALYDPLGQVETVQVAHGLSARTPHYVEIVAHGGWGQWPLASWTVRQEQVPPPGPPVYTLLFLAGAGMFVVGATQIQRTSDLHRPLYTLIGRVFQWYRDLPEWIPILATLSTALAFYTVPWSLPSILLLGVWFVLAFLRIDLGLAAVALALPFYLKPKVLLGRPFSAVELGVWLCALAWLAARLLDIGRAASRSGPRPLSARLPEAVTYLGSLPDRLWRNWTALDKGMAALALLAALSLGWAARQEVAVREFRTVFLESALFYALVRLALRSPRAHQRLAEGWLLGAVFISSIAIGQWIAGQNLITAEGVSRVRGFYGSPNNLALYLERALPFLLAIAWQGNEPRRRIVYGAAALPVLGGLLLTLSRGALLLGLPAALLALGILPRRRKGVWLALGALAVVALAMAPFVLTERFQGLFSLSSGTGFFRLKLWRSTLAMIADHPITGVGLDQFLYAYRTRYILPSAWQELNLSHPHNFLLDTWTRLGLPGVAIMAWLLVSFLRTTWRQFRGTSSSQGALYLGLSASMAAILAHGLVDHAVFTVDLAYVFALLLAMADPKGHT